MSRAFTREDDARDAVLPKPVSPLPPGARNYLTPLGAQRLREELARLTETERPRLIAASSEEGGRGADAKEELQRVETRLAYLQQSLATAEVVAPPLPPHEIVRFGATVTVRDAKGIESTYRIVGVDEADFSRDEVSWLAPIARALLNARLGQKVPFKFPSGQSTLEIVGIRYD
jgi:transcription elongation factor GreB